MITEKAIRKLDFDDIAEKILNSYELVIKNERYRICEIEFYCRCAEHDDRYTHCSKDQQEYEKFYFHKYATGTYKSGTYKGMDITFGNKNMYYGILIRSIYNISKNEFIEGPCRTVNKVLELNGCQEVKELLRPNEILSIYGDDRVRIECNRDMEYKNIYKGSRIGLSDKYPDYRDRRYRYVIYKNRIKKERNKLELMI